MPRRVTRAVRARKRPTKWCGSSSLSIVANQASLAVADGVPLCSGTTAIVDQADPTVGWCRGGISLSRVGLTEKNPVVVWAIVMMRTTPGTTTPLQIFNPFDSEDLERQDILGMGHIAVPPVVLLASDGAAESKASLTAEVNVRVGRKYHRNTNQLILWIVAAGAQDNAYEATATIRTLMKFG